MRAARHKLALLAHKYLLYQHKSTNTDAEGVELGRAGSRMTRASWPSANPLTTTTAALSGASLSLYAASIQPLLRLCSGSVQALLRLCL
jgi:hypothetical protein